MRRNRRVALIEEGLVFGDPHVGLNFHQKKIVFHRASMMTYAAVLERRGYDVRYRDFIAGATIADHVRALRDKGLDHAETFLRNLA